MRRLGPWLITVVLAGALASGCAAPPAICSGLDDGQSTLEAASNAFGDAVGDPAAVARKLRDGASTVRASCSEHAQAADEMDGYARVVARQAAP